HPRDVTHVACAAAVFAQRNARLPFENPTDQAGVGVLVADVDVAAIIQVSERVLHGVEVTGLPGEIEEIVAVAQQVAHAVLVAHVGDLNLPRRTAKVSPPITPPPALSLEPGQASSRPGSESG